MEIVNILTAEEVVELTSNSKILELNETEINKLVKKISIKIWSKIDNTQFLSCDGYEIPTDLKVAAVNLLDNYYNMILSGNSSLLASKSERIDDYSIEETYKTSNYDVFGIPTDSDTIEILDKYGANNKFGIWDIDLH